MAKTKKQTARKKTKKEWLEDLRGQKKELQQMRFGLTTKARQKTSGRRNLRRNIARTITGMNGPAGKKEEKSADRV